MIAIGLIFMLAGAGDASPAESPPAERLALATMLLRDGHEARALPLLETLDPTSEDIDAVELHRLTGLVLLKLDRPADAAASLQLALHSGDTEARTHLLLADAHLQAKAPARAIEVLSRAPVAVEQYPERFLAEAVAHHALENKPEAFEALSLGLQKFPTHRILNQRRLLLLVELGLAHTAIAEAEERLADNKTPDDYLTVAAALRQASRPADAAELLEQARLLFADNQDVTTQLALSYHEAGQHLTAAELLLPLALVNPEHALFAAELYRRSGKLERAVQSNARVADQKKKLHQRLSLLIEGKRWALAAQLEERCARLGLLDDEELLYALAYAHFQMGEGDRAERLLSKLSRPDLFERALVLRRAMARCDAEGGCS